MAGLSTTRRIGTPAVFAAVILVASAALAHQGVTNAAVMARMNGMSDISAAMKTLGAMSKGATPFDAKIAHDAAQSVATHASEIPDLFKGAETDPKSEAKSVIWEDFDDFTAKSLGLEKAALAAASNIEDQGDLRRALRRIGRTCTACHKIYRE